MTNRDSGAFYFNSLVMVPSYRCNARCAHCISECGDNFAAGWDKNFVDEVIRQAESIPHTELGRRIHFAGGEPFLFFDNLLYGLRKARESGFETSVVTNGFWGTNTKSAEEFASRLWENGLSRIEISVDHFHQARIPINSVRLAIKALKDREIPIYLRIIETQSHKLPDAIQDIPLEELIDVYLVASPLIPLGRARSLIENEKNTQIKTPEGCCLWQLNLTVTPDGFVYPCCAGSELSKALRLGTLKQTSLWNILDNLKYRMELHGLFREGPGKLLEIVRAILPAYERKTYVDMCHACVELFQDPKAVSIIREYYYRSAAKKLVEQMMSSL